MRICRAVGHQIYREYDVDDNTCHTCECVFAGPALLPQAGKGYGGKRIYCNDEHAPDNVFRVSVKAYEVAYGYSERNEDAAEKNGADEQRGKGGLEEFVLIGALGGKAEVSRFQSVGENDIDKGDAGVDDAEIAIVGHARRIVEHVRYNGGKQLVQQFGGNIAQSIPYCLSCKLLQRCQFSLFDVKCKKMAVRTSTILAKWAKWVTHHCPVAAKAATNAGCGLCVCLFAGM